MTDPFIRRLKRHAFRASSDVRSASAPPAIPHDGPCWRGAIDTALYAAAALALTTANPVTAQPKQVGAFPAGGVHMEIITLPAAPPGRQSKAPGGGFVNMPAILFTPPAGENVHGPAIVMIDQGPASNPLREGQSTRFAAERLAARGYTVLSLYTNLQREFALFPFESTAVEIDAALSALEQRGYENFVLSGGGYGAIAVADYMKRMPDEPLDVPGTRRVKAVLLFSPLTELRAYPRADLAEPDYAARSAAAAASVAAATGTYPKGNTIEVGGRPDAKVDPWIGNGIFNGPPEQFESFWSPRAAVRNADLLAALRVPTLVIGAGRDPEYSQTHLKTIAPAAPMQFVSYPQADSGFTGKEGAASDAVAGFLEAHGLGVPPRVIETVIDVTTADGRRLPAVVYAPEGSGDPKKPAYLFVHGRTGDTVDSSGHWVGWHLAQRGYVVFTPEFRISGVAGFGSSNMQEQADDLGRWIAAIDRLGFHRLVAVGHSNGGIYISNYMAQAHDPRVIGVAFMAPTLNERERTIEQEGRPMVDAQLAEAKAAIDRGEGTKHMIGYLTAQTFWDVNNPATRGRHTDRIREYSVPTISIVGRNDPLFKGNDFLDRFTAAQKPGMTTTLMLDNGTHGMRESKDKVADAIVGWTQKTFPSR